MPREPRAGIPSPTHLRAVEPTAVVIRRPAPRLVADPSPAIPVRPSPLTRAIRRPADGLIRLPNVAIVGSVRPSAILVQVLRPGNPLRNILIAGRIQLGRITALVPVVPIVDGYRVRNLKLGIRSLAARQQGLAFIHPLRSGGGGYLDAAQANADLGLARIVYSDPINSFF